MLAYPYIPSLFALLLILIHLIRVTFMIHDGKYMQKVTLVGGYHGKITEKLQPAPTTAPYYASPLAAVLWIIA
jgi:hypothetical protein